MTTIVAGRAFVRQQEGGIGEAVEGVEIRFTGPGPSRAATTAANGTYRVELEPGRWRVVARLEGFDATRTAIVAAEERQTLNVFLERPPQGDLATDFRRRVKEITGCRVETELRPERTFNGPDTVSVDDFGAAGDGETEDTAAVQRAVDRVIEDGGGIVVFPPGRYLLDSVACGPGVTFWGYGATIVKPGIRFYCEKYLRSTGTDLDGEALERRLDELRALAFEVDQETMRRAIVTLRCAAIGRAACMEEFNVKEEQLEALLLSEDELEAVRTQVVEILDRGEIGDEELLELLQQLRGGRGQAKWARTFRTGDSRLAVPDYRYRGDDLSAPLAFLGFRFDGNRRSMGQYTRYELEQQHMIFLAAHPRSRGRLSAWVRDLCLQDGVADGISIYRNVDVTIRNVAARDVFRGAVTCTGGNSKVDLADLQAGGEDHPTGIDWEIDGGSFVRDGMPLAAPSYHNETVVSNLVLDGDFDVALRSGSSFHGEDIRLLAPPFNFRAALCSDVVIRDSSFAVGNVLSSNRADDIRSGRYTSVIRQPQSVLFDNVEFLAVLPEEGELNRPLAYYSALVLVMRTQYVQPRHHHLRFRRCRFAFHDDAEAPADVELRALSTGNDTLANLNGTVLEGCTVEAGFDHALFIGGGSGPLGNWGSAGGGYFRFVDTEVAARVAAFVGGNESFQTHVDLRGVVPATGFEELFERPENQEDSWVTILT